MWKTNLMMYFAAAVASDKEYEMEKKNRTDGVRWVEERDI